MVYIFFRGRFTEHKEIPVNDLTKLIKLKDSYLARRMYLLVFISRHESYETRHKEPLIAP